jgi:hypothetical protein
MHLIRQTLLLAALAAAAGPTSAARAAEAYLCDNNRLVYVETADLARMIQTDPCIARYHGAATQASGAGEPPLVRLTAPMAVAVETPAAKPSAVRPTAAVATAAPVPAVAPRGRRSERSGGPAGPQPVRAAPGTDYTNVRVINASDEAERWFRVAR